MGRGGSIDEQARKYGCGKGEDGTADPPRADCGYSKFININYNENRNIRKRRADGFAVGLGCMGFTQSYPPYPDRKDAIETIRRAVDLGVTFFDTAEVYSYGKNEDFI